MVKSFFTTGLSSPIRSGQETKQIKINFLLPIVFLTILFSIFSLISSIISKEYGLMIAFISSVVLLLLSFDFLRNGSLNTPVVLFLVQGFGLLTVLALSAGIDLIPQVLLGVFYLIVTGMVTNPKIFSLLFVYSAVLLYLMVSGIVTPLIPVRNLPLWFSFTASLILSVLLLAFAIFLAYRAMMQSLQIAENANQLQDQAEQDRNKYFSMIEQNPLSIFTTDLEGKIEYVNQRFTELMEYESDEILGKNPRIFKTEHTPADFHEDLWEKITEGRTWIGEFINQKKDESTLYQSAVIRPLINSSGEKTGYVAYEDDISLQKEISQEMRTMDQELKEKIGEIKNLQDQLHDQSIHDAVTGLYNRVHLNEVLPHEILRATRAKNHLILQVIDIDNFQSINQEFGYSIGDRVLKSVADTISASLGAYDLAFRYGDDEFVVLYSGKSGEMGETHTEHLRDAIENLMIPSDKGEIRLTVSIGVSIFPVHGKKEGELLNKAEQALSISKQSGGNRTNLWSEN